MTPIHLWLGLPGSGRRDNAMKALREAVRRDENVWWIVDDLRRAERVERDLCDALGGALIGVDVLATGRLAAHLLGEAGKRVQTVDVEVRDLLLRDLMSGAGVAALVDSELTPGWARRLAEFYERVQEERFVGPREGRRPVLDRLRARYPWAVTVLERYDSRLADAGLVDEASLPALASEVLASDTFPPPGLVIVDRLGPQRPAVLELLHGLASAAAQTIVLVDDLPSGGDGLALARVDAEGWRRRHDAEERTFPPPESNRRVAELLFSRNPAPDHPATGRRVTLSHHLDRAAEVRAVADEAARLMHDEGLADSDIAVVCTRLDEYTPYVEELFERYGLRPDLRIGVPLSTSPVARLTAALFDLRAGGLSREGITDLLLNPYVRWGKHLRRDADVLAFDTAARQARITDGRGSLKEAWLEPLEAERQRLIDLARQAEFDDNGGREENEASATERRSRERYTRRADWLGRVIGDFRGLANAILALPDPCTVEEVLAWVRTMHEALGVRTAVHRLARHDPQRGQRDVLALGHIELTLDHVAATLRLQGKIRWSVEKFAELFRLAINTARLRPGRRLRGGVPVMGPLELRGLNVRHLFFLGLTADAWPRSPGIDLADPTGSEWTDIDRLAESRALTLEAFFAGEQLHLSTPSPASGEGRDAPSPLLEDVFGAGVEKVLHERGAEDAFRSALDLLPEAGRGLADAASRPASLRRLAAAHARDQRIAWKQVPFTVAVETIRQDPHTLSRFEGLLGDHPVGEMLAQRVLSRPLSASRLDVYARCPMQFLLGRTLNVEPLEDVEDEADAASIGSLVHEILARTTQRLRALRGGSPDFSDNPEEVAEVMADIADTLLADHPYDNLYWQRIVQAVTSGLRDTTEPEGYLRRVITNHVDKLEGERIFWEEAAFGLPAEEGQDALLTDPITITAEGVAVELAGRIDRISLHPKKGWRVWDYKVTGSTPSNVRKIAGGRNFQLPLYFWVLEELRDSGQLEDLEFEKASYYVLKPDGVTHSRVWKYKDHADASDDLKRRVVQIHRAIERGRYHHPLSQDDDLCADSAWNYCPFRHVCRRDHALFREREEKLDPAYLRDAYILGFQERLAERRDAEGGAS